MINTTDLTDTELLILWHRLNCNSRGFWNMYDPGQQSSPQCRYVDEQEKTKLWNTINRECAKRGISAHKATVTRTVTKTVTEVINP